MNNILHVSKLLVLISCIFLLETQIEMDVSTRRDQPEPWEYILSALWSDQNGVSLQLGPILIGFLSILCIFGLLRYYYDMEEQIIEY